MKLDNVKDYSEQSWKNAPDKTTPINADRLNHMEAGIKSAADGVKAIIDAVKDEITDDANKIPSMAALYGVNKKVGTDALPEGMGDLVRGITTLNDKKADKEDAITWSQWFDLHRTGWHGGVTFPQFASSQSPLGTKTGDNADVVVQTSTATTKGRNDFADKPVTDLMFNGLEVNGYIDEDGEPHITAVKGSPEFSRDGSNGDVYMAFFPTLEEGQDEDSEEYGLIILRCVPGDEEDTLESVDDETVLNAVYDLFMETLFEEEEDGE